MGRLIASLFFGMEEFNELEGPSAFRPAVSCPVRFYLVSLFFVADTGKISPVPGLNVEGAQFPCCHLMGVDRY